MKKLILSAAIVLGSLTTAVAQEPAGTGNTATTEQTTQTENATATEATSTGEFTEIKIEEVPAAVTAALTKAYPDAVLNKAYVNDQKEYQLDVKVGDKEGSLFADESGKWIQK
ncbi:hypothetical protein FFWV33_05755 [Flavobacterium faecale]|uniref:Beta-lactamase-inhibitor-like PepSY-like domain-containing protein n=1 Tax=Flavobacterium faecale TaxID=1355330 RepID=A0A2S1LBF8_9FLAO|nr:hypothetical protein [Flavobacterium faecale]AWG21071.1 hypothetical protein FFWV33_05755 [Flavobacterium faecale]